MNRLLVVVCGLVGTWSARANAEPHALYLRNARTAVATASGDISNRLLSPEAPVDEKEATRTVGVGQDQTETLATFVSAAPQLAAIAVPAQTAVLYLAIGRTPMQDCAEITVDVYRVGGTRHDRVLTGALTTTLVQQKEGARTDPVVVPLVPGEAEWHLDSGDGLQVDLRVFNGCGDGERQISLIYDAQSQASRLAFEIADDASRSGFVDNCPSTPNPDQLDGDRDGIGDGCDVCPALVTPDQTDSDGDGVGNACDNCVLANTNQLDGNGDGVGDVCQVPPVPGACGPCPCRADLDTLACWLKQLDTTLSTAPPAEVAPELRRPQAQLRLFVRRSLARVAAMRAQATSAPTAARLDRLRRRVVALLRKFDHEERSARRRDKIAVSLHDRLRVILAKARYTEEQWPHS